MREKSSMREPKIKATTLNVAILSSDEVAAKAIAMGTVTGIVEQYRFK